MTGADLSVLEVTGSGDSHRNNSAGNSAQALLPEHYCGRCMSLCFVDDEHCLECRRPRPARGWSRLCDSGDPWLGRIMKGRYLLTRRLGKGASASVYEAESLRVPRRFAIKVVDYNACTSSKDPDLVRARVNREVEAISRLNNPHTVPLYEVLDLSESCVGVVMNYVKGHTLDRLLDECGSLGWRAACRIVRQMASGTHAVHQAGLVHRDLKPANIMVERMCSGEEFVRILDFGIVWMDDGLEVTQGFVGTPLYASPEQALGEGVDRRSDIYSLGAIFFEMLTGRPPFHSHNVMEVLRMHVRQSPPSLTTASGGHSFPYPVRSLVDRMLAKSREARPLDLAEVIETLDAILNGEFDAPSVPYLPVPTSRPPAGEAAVARTAPGLGVIESVAEEVDAQPDAPGADPVVSDEFFIEAISAVESLGNADSLFESDEHDATGPKAAIFRPRTDRHRALGSRAP